MRQRLDAGGVDSAHLFNRGEEAVELREHALTLFDAELKPCQMGNAADVLGSQCHGRKNFGNEIKAVTWRM